MPVGFVLLLWSSMGRLGWAGWVVGRWVASGVGLLVLGRECVNEPTIPLKGSHLDGSSRARKPYEYVFFRATPKICDFLLMSL